MFKKVTLFCFVILCCVPAVPAQIKTIKVCVLKNEHNAFYDETTKINEAFSKFLKQKEIFDENEAQYFSQKEILSEKRKLSASISKALEDENEAELDKQQSRLSEIESQSSAEDEQSIKIGDEFPLEVKVISFEQFDLRPLFQHNRIIADFIAEQNDCDYLIIPASLPLENNLIRARLVFYNCITKTFNTVYDEIIRQSEFAQYINDNFIGLFPYFLNEGMGIVNFVEKEYGYEVFYEGEKVEDDSVFLQGEKIFTITSPGYQTAQVALNVKKNQINNLTFELSEKINDKVVFRTDGFFYDAFSSEKGSFTLPDVFFEYKTPQSISFSYPNYTTKYISLVGETKQIDIMLKPNYLLDDSFMQAEVRNFYTTVVISLSAFALDILARSFLQQYPDSLFWNVGQKSASYLGYFTISLIVINLFDYFYSTTYAFE